MHANHIFSTKLIVLAILAAALARAESPLWKAGISLIPYPQQVRLGGEDFVFEGEVGVVLDAAPTAADRFAAGDFAARMRELYPAIRLGGSPAAREIRLTRAGAPANLGEQGYELTVEKNRITVRAEAETGLFYGTRTVLQLVQRLPLRTFVRGLQITDRPDVPQRAIHYDTKHHQDKAEYVRQFIRTLADYKINTLIWEWEDKFAYPSHPEIGAPGAFSMEEMQALTRYAGQYHVQIVPLVQGLGHVSFILKWPQHANLREIAASNWEFCPRKEGTYKLLFDLWEDAIKATPGSTYIHIGSDESYEVGEGIACGCRERARQVGRDGLMVDFVDRCSRHLMARGRKVMAWIEEYKPDQKLQPPKGLVTFPEPLRLELAKHSVDAGYPAWIYDPNPGIEHLFLPYLYRRRDGRDVETSLESSYKTLATASPSGIFEGMVCTSWDDSGLHNQMWMMRFVHAAEYSWNGNAPTQAEFVDKYLANYYGTAARDVRELWTLLDRGAYFYTDSFGRMVWHVGDAEKTALPDLPRGDDIEYKPFWNAQYKGRVETSQLQVRQMERALDICRHNQELGLSHAGDFEIFAGIARLIEHAARTYLALSEVENAIGDAQRQHFLDHWVALAALEKAAAIVETNLKERTEVYDELVGVWEKTRLPKGMSTPDKQFFYAQDRARHFASRRPDMSYLIYDEQLLGLEAYLGNLRDYAAWYKQTIAGGNR